jgi:methanogenic corrinoid protein MtbC1
MAFSTNGAGGSRQPADNADNANGSDASDGRQPDSMDHGGRDMRGRKSADPSRDGANVMTGQLQEPQWGKPSTVIPAPSESDIARFEPDGAAPQQPDEAQLDFSQRARLTRTVETQVIPRLLMAHRGVQSPSSGGMIGTDFSAIESSVITQFTELVRNSSEAQAFAFAEQLRKGGVSVEEVYLDLLAPTARELGDMWLNDRCSFAEVTMGLWRLQQLLRRLSPAFYSEVEQTLCGQSALLVPVPGEQHTFGLSMVAEFFRRAGWDTINCPVSTQDELLAMVNNQWFAIAGLSVAGESQLDGLTKAIHGIRRNSRNRHIGIMVGGPIFEEHPDLVHRVGADATAADAAGAPRRAGDLVKMLT